MYKNLSRRLVAVMALCSFVACSGDGPTSSSQPPVPQGEVLVPGAPDGWSGSAPYPFTLGLDQTTRHGGKAALYFAASAAQGAGATTAFATVAQSIRVDDYRGKRVRWSAWVKQSSVVGRESGLWMRVDGPGVTLGFDNMASRPLTGTADWHEVSVVLDVPANAMGISFGVLSNASGSLLVDDGSFTAVGNDVPSTSTSSGPSGVDSATVAAAYARAASAPVNLDFEGISGPPTTALQWLGQHVVPLATTDPTAALDDLQPLASMVGSAHVVGMGEDTHGTRQFFQMKHRLLEFLVTKMGFTTFAIEATSPESDDMNRYVLTGQGDPRKLLSRLYFWTWNTQEVLDMVQWMRQWNSTAPPSQQVRFLGFDMQSPGAAMDSVAAFVGRVDPADASVITNGYACLATYRNHGPTLGASAAQYAALDSQTKAACAANLQSVYDLIQRSGAAYTAASSAATYQQVLHDARLVQQFEAMIAIADAGASSLSRDQSMAENVEWIRDQLGPDAKLALWAHNQHINAVPESMGGYLRAQYGADYLALGFAFGTGSFNAVGANGVLDLWQATVIPPASIEAAFVSTQKSLALFDARQIPQAGAVASPLGGPIAMRSIGAVFDASAERSYFFPTVFPSDFDLLIYVATTSGSTLLPFTF